MATLAAGTGIAAGAGTAAAGLTAVQVGAAVVGGAIGGAVGSIVGQGLMIAAGYQDKFSWRQVGISAIGSVLRGNQQRRC